MLCDLGQTLMRYLAPMLALLFALAALPCAHAQGDGGEGTGDSSVEGFNDLGIRMRAEVVFDGRIQSNRWSCAMVTVENVGEPIDGLLMIQGGVTDDGGESARYTRAIDVGRKARKRVFLYFETEGWGAEWTVQLLGSGGRGGLLAVAPVRTTTVEAEDVVIAVVGEDPMGLNVVREAWPGAVPGHPEVSQWERRRVHLSLATVESLPDRWLGYNVVDALVWIQPDPTGMSDDQLAAIAHFVGNGGTLVLAVTDGWQLVRDSAPLADLLPVTLQGAVESEGVPGLLYALDVDGAALAEGETILTADARVRGDDAEVRAVDGDRVLWAVREYGLGRVVFLGVDPTMRPIKGSQRDLFWRHVLWLPEPEGGQRDNLSREDLLRDQLGEAYVPNNAVYWHEGEFTLAAERPISECVHDADEMGTANLGWSSTYYYGASASDTWVQEVRRKLGDIPALQPLPMGWILLFAAVYLLCIGPLDYFFLRLIGRQEWTWVTFPLLIAVFFVAAVVGTTAAKGRKAIMTRIEVVDVIEPEGFWRGQSHVGVFSSQRTDLTLRSVQTHSAVEPMRYVPTTYWWGADQLDEGFMKRQAVQVGVGGGALGYRAETWTMAYLESAWVDAEGGHGHFRLRHDGDGRVSVINDSDVGLYSAVLLFAESGTRAVGTSETRTTDPADLAGLLAATDQWNWEEETPAPTITWGQGAYRTHHLGPLLAGASVQVDLDQLATDVQTVYPEPPERALARPHDREDWDHFKEMPEFWDRRGHLDLTRALMAGQLVLLGFTSTPVEAFELEGLDPVSEPRTIVRAVLGDDPRAARDAPNRPKIRTADPTESGANDPVVLGSLASELIRARVGSHMLELNDCYQSALMIEGSELRGSLTARFVIDADGYIMSSEIEDSTTGSYHLDSCIQSSIWGWTFPAPPGGGIVVVKYPFTFEPV